MKFKHILITLVAALMLALGLAGCKGGDQPEDTAPDTGSISETVTDSATEAPTAPVTQPITEAPTEPITEPTTEPVTQPETVPETLSAEQAAALEKVKAAMTALANAERLSVKTWSSTTMEIPGLGSMSVSYESLNVKAGDDFMITMSSDEGDASLIVVNKVVYSLTQDIEGAQKLTVTLTDEAYATLLAASDMATSDFDIMMDAEDISAVRNVHVSEDGCVISFDIEGLLSPDLDGEGDAAEACEASFTLDKDGVLISYTIRLSTSVEMDGATMACCVDVTSCFETGEQVVVDAPSDADTYTPSDLQAIMELWGYAEIPEEVLYVTADSLRVRSAPDFTDDSNIIGYLHKGDVVLPLEMTDSYCMIMYKDQIAYIGVNYLSTTPPEV